MFLTAELPGYGTFNVSVPAGSWRATHRGCCDITVHCRCHDAASSVQSDICFFPDNKRTQLLWRILETILRFKNDVKHADG